MMYGKGGPFGGRVKKGALMHGAAVTVLLAVAISGERQDYSRSETDRSSTLWAVFEDGYDAVYGGLSAVAHGRDATAAESHLRIAEHLLVIVLSLTGAPLVSLESMAT